MHLPAHNGRHQRPPQSPRIGRGLARAIRLGCLWLSLAPSVRAEASPQEKAAAEALFDQALTLMRGGNFEPACTKLEQSQEIDPGVGTLLYLAECYERTHRLASAWALFREASSAAQAAGQLDRSQVATERAEKLGPLLSHLSIAVRAEARRPGLAVRLDDRLIPPALYGVAFPVDEGSVRLTIQAPGYIAQTVSLKVSGGASYHELLVPPLQEDLTSSVAQSAVPLAPANRNPTRAETTPFPASAGPGHSPSGLLYPPASYGTDEPQNTAGNPPHATKRALGAGLGVVGVVSLGVGVLFGMRADDKDAEADEFCEPAGGCWDVLGEIRSGEARSAAMIANASYGLGIAALAAGSWMLFSIPSEDTASRVQVRIAPGDSGQPRLHIRGAF